MTQTKRENIKTDKALRCQRVCEINVLRRYADDPTCKNAHHHHQRFCPFSLCRRGSLNEWNSFINMYWFKCRPYVTVSC